MFLYFLASSKPVFVITLKLISSNLSIIGFRALVSPSEHVWNQYLFLVNGGFLYKKKREGIEYLYLGLKSKNNKKV